MIRAFVAGLLLAASSMIATPAQAGVVCSFTGSGANGTDCLGQAWAVGFGGWGIPGLGKGSINYAGTQTLTDFHFHCLTGCGAITNPDQLQTAFSLAPFVSTYWNESINAAADTIDFSAASAADFLTTGRRFFVNILVPINRTSDFTFEAWWTNDAITVPEPSSLPLIGLALLGLGVARRSTAA